MKQTRRQRLENNALVGRLVVLARDITTRGGRTYPKGTLMQVYETFAGKFAAHLVTQSGRMKTKRGCVAGFVRNLDRDDFDLEGALGRP